MKTSSLLKLALVLTMSSATLLPFKAEAKAITVDTQKSSVGSSIQNRDFKGLQKTINSKPAVDSATHATFTSPTAGSSSSANKVDLDFTLSSNNPDFENRTLMITMLVSKTADYFNGDTYPEVTMVQKEVNYLALGSSLSVSITGVPLLFKGSNYISCYVEAVDVPASSFCGDYPTFDSHQIIYTGSEFPVYRFWSDSLKTHFYTMSPEEKKYVSDTYYGVWAYERIAYFATEYTGTACANSKSPVYRFWSALNKRHFYTISLTEKNYIIANYPAVWAYERIAFCADPTQVVGTVPVYRFMSPSLKAHFFTVSETEKNYVIATYPTVWQFEGIAYYVSE